MFINIFYSNYIVLGMHNAIIAIHNKYKFLNTIISFDLLNVVMRVCSLVTPHNQDCAHYSTKAKGYPGKGYPRKGYPVKGYPGKGYPGKGYPGIMSALLKGYPGKGYPDVSPAYPTRYKTRIVVERHLSFSRCLVLHTPLLEVNYLGQVCHIDIIEFAAMCISTTESRNQNRKQDARCKTVILIYKVLEGWRVLHGNIRVIIFLICRVISILTA